MKEVIFNNISASIKLDDPQIHYNNSSFSNAFNTGLSFLWLSYLCMSLVMIYKNRAIYSFL